MVSLWHGRVKTTRPKIIQTENYQAISQVNMLKQIKNAALIAAGTICAGIGVIGILLPLIPGTPFLLVAAACFNAIEQ